MAKLRANSSLLILTVVYGALLMGGGSQMRIPFNTPHDASAAAGVRGRERDGDQVCIFSRTGHRCLECSWLRWWAGCDSSERVSHKCNSPRLAALAPPRCWPCQS
jgi:hypothetical protein